MRRTIKINIGGGRNGRTIKLIFGFLENDKKVSLNTLQSYRRDLKQFEKYIEDNGEDYAEVTNDGIKEYIEHMQEIGKNHQQYQED